MLVMNECIKCNLLQLEVRKQTYKFKLGITFLKEEKTYLGETNAFFATIGIRKVYQVYIKNSLNDIHKCSRNIYYKLYIMYKNI